MRVAVITLTLALVVTGKKYLVETKDSGHRHHGKVGKWGVHHEKGNELGQNISFTSFECFNERFTHLNTNTQRDISAF